MSRTYPADEWSERGRQTVCERQGQHTDLDDFRSAVDSSLHQPLLAVRGKRNSRGEGQESGLGQHTRICCRSRAIRRS
jgi:hypothetical protein